MAIMSFWTFDSGVWTRLQIELEGTIISRRDAAPTVYANGPTTRYTIREADGSLGDYTATIADPSLPRTLPIGGAIVKRKGDLFYLLDGKRIDDFPITADFVFLGVGIGSMVAGSIWIARSGRAKRARAG
jgi:hypothetical protein